MLNQPVVSKLKVEFNYSTIASTIQLFIYSTVQVKVGGDLEGEGVRKREKCKDEVYSGGVRV